jgi:RNA polymerase sigma-70 factor (ECF subfamily)
MLAVTPSGVGVERVNTTTDSELVRRCLAGDEDAFRVLVQRHERPVYHIIWRMVTNTEDARDLVQETFVKAFRALDQFDQARTFSFWINRIATNLSIDFLRKRRLRTISIDPDPNDEERLPPVLRDGSPLPDRVLETRRVAETLGRLVNRLAPHYRVVVHLRHAQQRSYDEIAEMLDLPLGTVKARLHRAHNQMRAWMRGEDGHDEPVGMDA